MPQILVQDDRDKIEKSDSDDESARHAEEDPKTWGRMRRQRQQDVHSHRQQQGENPQQHREDISDGVTPLEFKVGLHVEISGRPFGREPLVREACLR